MTESEDQAPAYRTHQAPDPETDPGPVRFIGVGVVSLGPRRLSRAVGYAPAAAFAAMSVRCWEPSRRMRPTAV